MPTPSAPDAAGLPLALEGQRVAVLGLAKSGVAAAQLLLARGAQVTAVDAKPEAELGEVAAKLKAAGATLRVGAQGDAALREASLIVVSPGVPLSLPALVSARAAGAHVVGEIELAWRCLPRRDRCVGITGTNGKSTTTALTGELFSRTRWTTFVGGNLGRPLSEAALQPGGYDAHVVELSSFQLEGIETARFQGAAILNLTPDHLDRYASPAAYGAAKARIFATQQSGDFAVVNADDAGVLGLAEAAKVPVYGFSMTGRPAAAKPALAGLAMAGLKGTGGRGLRFEFGGREQFELPEGGALRGDHNLQNAMAAALLAHLSGVGADAIAEGLKGFGGLAHRLERVRELHGVEWVNDSKATNVDSSLVALQAFAGRRQGPFVWLIAGGKGKGAPYAPLVAASRGTVKAVLTIGQDAPAIATAYEGAAKVHACGTLADAVARGRELATEGDVVLLSPACASYDQFKNFEDRGDTFKRLVGELQ